MCFWRLLAARPCSVPGLSALSGSGLFCVMNSLGMCTALTLSLADVMDLGLSGMFGGPGSSVGMRHQESLLLI